MKSRCIFTSKAVKLVVGGIFLNVFESSAEGDRRSSEGRVDLGIMTIKEDDDKEDQITEK